MTLTPEETHNLEGALSDIAQANKYLPACPDVPRACIASALYIAKAKISVVLGLKDAR